MIKVIRRGPCRACGLKMMKKASFPDDQMDQAEAWQPPIFLHEKCLKGYTMHLARQESSG